MISRNCITLLLAVVGGFLAIAHVEADTTVTTEPVGFLQTTCLGASDTFLSLPFTRPVEFIGTVASVSGSTITISGTQGWSTNQFVYVPVTQPKTYYVLIGNHPSSNSNEGIIYPVASNGGSSLTVNLNGDSISGVAPGTQILVYPYWTMGTIFPPSDANVSFIPSTSPGIRQTQILIPNYSGTGTNLSTAATYFFYNNSWRRVGSLIGEDHADDVLLPNAYFTLRNSSMNLSLTVVGSVPMRKLTAPLATQATVAQDNFATAMRPVAVTLNNSGLISSGAFAASTSPGIRKDQVLVFDNTVPGINKSASATYFYYSSAWRKVGAVITTDFGNDPLPLGGGFVIRKALSVGGLTQFWQNSPAY